MMVILTIAIVTVASLSNLSINAHHSLSLTPITHAHPTHTLSPPYLLNTATGEPCLR